MKVKIKLCELFRSGVFGLLLVLLCFAQTKVNAAQTRPIIAVSSNLHVVMEEITQAFERKTDLQVRLSYGSSSNLTRQILRGAQFEMFLSADEDHVFRLADADMTLGRGKLYAEGRIVVFSPNGSPLQQLKFPTGFDAIFDVGAAKRFAIAKPELAPYGRAAKEALMHALMWRGMKAHLIYGESISQTGQFVLSGSTLGGIISYAQALSSPFRDKGTYQLIASTFHRPLTQRMVLLKKAGAIAKRFYDFIGEQEAVAILRKYGFDVP